MASEENPRKRKLSLRVKLAFASGSLEESMLGAAAITTLIFYNQVMGLSPALCGTVLFIASVADAVSDPLVGALSDSVPSRWGRRHPFMLLSALPLGVFFYLLYQPPSGLSESQLFAWFTVTVVGLRLAKTFYSVPHSALGAELTDDYDERTSVFGWNFLVYSIGGTLLGLFVLFMVFPSTEGYENGLLNVGRYRFLAVFGAIFVSVMVLVCTFATADQIPYLHDTQPLVERSKKYYMQFLREALRNLRALLRSPSYISVCGTWIIMFIAGGVLAVVSIYTFIYAFEFSTETMGVIRIIALPGAAAGIFLSAWFVRRLDKKYTVICACFVVATFISAPYCLRLMGWFPENGSIWLLPAFLGLWTPAFLLLPVIPIVIESQLVDIADEHELNTGNRSEGIIFSIRTFGIKATSGIGSMIAGFGLEWINFPEDASVETLEPEVVDGLLWMMGPLYIIIVYAGMAFAFLYRLDRKRHAEIMTELEFRRAQSHNS